MPEKKSDWRPIAILSSLGVIILVVFLATLPNEKPAPDHRKELEAIKAELGKADQCRHRWNKADREKDEAARIQHIRATKKAYEGVQDLVNKLRREPYAGPDGEFRPGYEFIEDYSSTASTHLHDIVRRSKIHDFD